MNVRLLNGTSASDADIMLTELELGCALPPQFKDFVKKFNGATPESNTFNFKSNNSAGVNAFIPIRKIKSVKTGIDGFLEGGYPIAIASGGNYVYLKTHGDDGVYFWDHEDDASTYPLASSFQQFLELIMPFDTNSVKLQPGQVIKAWIDPEFLKSIQKPKQ